MFKLCFVAALAPLAASAAPTRDPVTATIPQNKDGNVVLASQAKTAIEEVCYEAFFVDGGKDYIAWDCKEVSLDPGKTEEVYIPKTCGHVTPPLTKLVITSVGYAGGKRWVRPVTTKAGATPITAKAKALLHGASSGTKDNCKVEHVVLLQNTGKKSLTGFSGEYRIDGKVQTITMELAHPISASEERPINLDGTEFRLTSLTFADGTSWDAH
jgi:hypothetical protein